MPHARPQKRPCGVCRTWFLPNVRQKGRQVTCSPECSRERHRRQCERWNRKNKSYFKDIYMSQKLEGFTEPPPARPPPKQPGPIVEKKAVASLSTRRHLHLPWDAIENEFGRRQMIIIEYCIGQLVHRFGPSRTVLYDKQPAETLRHSNPSGTF
jgi:hypothetical protein